MLAWERQENESSRAYEAFCAYRDFGPTRSIAKVGHLLGKSRALLERWSVAHSWVDRVKALEARDEMIRRDAVETHLQRKAQDHAKREAALHEKALAVRERAMDQAEKMLWYPLTEQRIVEESEDGAHQTFVFVPANWNKATARTLYDLAIRSGEPPEEEDPAEEADLSQLSDEELHKYLELMQKTLPCGPGAGS